MAANAEVQTETLPAPAVPDPGALSFEIEDLRRRPLSLMVVQLITEWDSNAKRYLEQAEKSEVRSKINELFRQHKFWLGKFNAAVEPIVNGRRWAASALAQWERQRREKAEADRRQREAEARAEQERQRIEEAADLEAQGHVEEAHAHLEAPLPPVALPEPKEARGKVEQVTIIETYRLDDDNWLTDGKAFYLWMAAHPECWSMMAPVVGKWKTYLTAAKGRIVPDGAKVVRKDESRNRG